MSEAAITLADSSTLPASTPDASESWNRRLAAYAKAEDHKAWFQLLSTGALFVGTWALMLWSLNVSYWLTLLLALPQAGFYTRLFIFQHDCGHGSFFRSSTLNHRVGGVLGVITLFPYRYWRRTHAQHHATSGDLDYRELGDIATLTVREFQALSRWGKIRYRIYRFIPLMLLIGPTFQFVLKHRLPLNIPRSWKQEWRSVMWTNVALAGVLTVAALTIGLGRFALVQGPIIVFGGAFGVWLFYVQHQFEDTYWRDHPEWDFHQAALQGSSFFDLPQWLHWFTGNIGYHHIHHLASRVPNYRLRECFREVSDLRHVTRLTLRSSLRCGRLHLWDEESENLVGFRSLRGKTPTATPASAATAAG
jgi:omega-6 fatty acid desaturase (delta-12 desaturase)